MLFNLLFELVWKLIVIAVGIGLACIVLGLLMQGFLWLYDVHVLLGLLITTLVIWFGSRFLFAVFRS